MNRFTTLLAGSALFMLTASFVLKGDDTSSIEGKQYKITITDSKKSGNKAGEVDEATIKGGKFRCDFFKKNAGAEAIPIEIQVDSTYKDPDDPDAGETMYVEFMGEMTNKLEETVKVTATIDGLGIDGNVELSKKEKVKKHWDIVGMQKDKKHK